MPDPKPPPPAATIVGAGAIAHKCLWAMRHPPTNTAHRPAPRQSQPNRQERQPLGAGACRALIMGLRDLEQPDPHDHGTGRVRGGPRARIGGVAERLEVQRAVAAPAGEIFAVLTDPRGHVAIDSSGMLMAASGDVVAKAGDTFVVHMDREALNDYPLGLYDVTVEIVTFEPDREIAWTVHGLSLIHI